MEKQEMGRGGEAAAAAEVAFVPDPERWEVEGEEGG